MKLLVSPQNVGEAKAAIKGGADIIDIKNPAEGSLGANFPWVIKSIADIIPSDLEISATIGDLPNLPGTASLAALGAASCGVDYVKVGLYGISDVREGEYFMSQVVKSVKDYDNRVKVVVCAYADYKKINSLNPAVIPQIGKKSGSDVAMIDTAAKGEYNIFDLMSELELDDFASQSHKMGLSVALAGSVGKSHLKRLAEIGVDIVGVRGCVCEDGRDSAIDESKVAEIAGIVRSL